MRDLNVVWQEFVANRAFIRQDYKPGEWEAQHEADLANGRVVTTESAHYATRGEARVSAMLVNGKPVVWIRYMSDLYKGHAERYALK